MAEPQRFTVPLAGDRNPLADGRGIVLGPAWRLDCGLAEGDIVEVALLATGIKQRP